MKMKYLKYLGIIMLTIMVGCNNFDSFVVTEKPYVNQTSVQLFIGELAGDRNTIQLESGPTGNSYVWTSQDPSVATVDQTGLVKAVNEGVTSVIVASKDDKVVVDVTVKEFIPITSFTLSTSSIISFWQSTTPVFVAYTPDNATDIKIEWTSADRSIAEVYSNGLIKTLQSGRTTVTAKYGDIEQTIDVWVPEPPVKMDRSGWSVPGYDPNSNNGTIGYSSQQRNDGGGILAMFDDNINGTYWHTRWDPDNPSKYPHWFIVDLGEEVTIAKVSMARRNNDNRGQKGYQLLTCTESGAIDLNDPTVWEWEDQGDFSFNPDVQESQVQDIKTFPSARYVKVYMGEKHKGGDHAMIGDFSLYIFAE